MDIVARIRKGSSAYPATASIDDIKEILEQSDKLLGVAARGSDLAKNLENAQNIFRDSQGKLAGISESLDKLEKLNKRALHSAALVEIYQAYNVLKQDGIILAHGEVAAQAFGKLFGGLSQLAHELPPPASCYADVLQLFSRNFFVAYRKMVRPQGEEHFNSLITKEEY